MAARVNSTGADSDTFSAAAGTGASLMLPAKQRAPSKRGPQACLNPQVPAGTAPDIPAVPLSPKRKTIALQPGAVPLPDAGRKRRKLAKAGQAEHIKTAQESCHVTQQQSQLKQALPSSGCAASPHLAKYDVPVKDATAVDFMELQLARICNTQEPITASVVSAVAQDIYSAWASKHCPLECILKGFTAVLLDCTAAPAPAITQPSDASKQSPAVTVHSRCEADTSTEVCQTVEDSPFAKLWCSQTACQQHHFTWLMHCAVELDGLLRPSAKAQPDQPHGRAAANITRDPIQPSGALIAPAKGPSTLVKKRGRPPGSKNKKTLLKLQQEDASRDQLPSAKPVQLCTIGQQRQRSEQQQSQHQGEQQQACQQALPQQQKQQLHQQQARQQQQQQAGLPIGTLLDGLHKQVLHCLGQVCQVKSPGPFESEVCCVSAAAASLARLQGKVQVRQQQPTPDSAWRLALMLCCAS